MSALSRHPGAVRDLAFRGGSGLGSVGYALGWGASVLAWYVGMGSVRESGLRMLGGPAGVGSRHHRVPPLSSTGWSSWLGWCWCRCGRLWLASRRFPRGQAISFDFLVSHARRRIVVSYPSNERLCCIL